MKDERCLRSAAEVIGYRLRAADGNLGPVSDIVIDDEAWAVRYFVVRTRFWAPGPHVVIPAEWVEGVSWERGRVYVGRSREEIRQCPRYDPSILINWNYGALLQRSGKYLER